MKTNRHLAALLYFLIVSSSCLHAQTHWYLRHPLPTPNGLLGATYGNGTFVAVGYFGTVLTSPDAVTWTSRLPERDGILEDVAYGNGRFVAVGPQYDSDPTSVLTSTEGTVWTDGAPLNDFDLYRVVFANGLFVGFGGPFDPPVIVTSPDGMTWTERWRGTAGVSWASSYPWLGPIVAVGNETIVVNIARDDGSERFLVSTNGLSWVEVPTGLSSGSINHFDLSFGAGRFLALADIVSPQGHDDLKALVSGDGFAWESLTVRENWGPGFGALGFGNGSFLVLSTFYTNDSSGNTIIMPTALTSTDGRTWAEHSLNGLQFGYGPGQIHTVSKLLYAQNTFVMVGQPQFGQAGRNNFARVFTSPDGINWTRRVETTVDSFGGAVASDRGLVAIGSSGNLDNSGNSLAFLTSTNGTEWRETQRLDGQYLSSIVYGNGRYVAAGDTGIFSSSDGAAWTRQTNAGGGWSRLRYGVNKFLVLGVELDTAGKFHSKFGSSSDGSMWTTQRLDNVSSPRDVSTDGQSVVLIENGYPQPVVIWRSTDSTSWAEVYRGTQPSDPVTAFGNGRYVVVQSGSTDPASVLTSTNGTGWTTHAGFTEFGFNDLIFANGRFYGAERGHEFSGARVFSSSDGVQWTAHPTGFHPTLGNLAAGPQGLFAFGAGGVILHSPWDLVLTAPERALNGIMRVYVSGPQGANVQLQRGTTPTDWADWQMVTLNDAPVQVEDAEVAASSQRFYRAFTR